MGASLAVMSCFADAAWVQGRDHLESIRQTLAKGDNVVSWQQRVFGST